jgi:hypothetical protein
MLWLKFEKWILSIAGVFAAALSIYAIGRTQGGASARDKQHEADQKQSRIIEDAADRVRRHDGANTPAIDRLRAHGKLRD